jgi:CheY-like chemotaxis protein
MSLILPRTVGEGTDRFNRIQSQIVYEGRRRPAQPAPVAENGLLRVLIVDDQRDMTDILAMLVWRWGHEVQGTYDSATALRMAARHAPDVVVLDLAMPHLDGFQVAERLRGDTRLRDCFVIAITGYADTATWLRCHEVGIDLLLIKPVDPSIVETLLMLECERVNRSWTANSRATEPSPQRARGVDTATRLVVGTESGQQP